MKEAIGQLAYAIVDHYHGGARSWETSRLVKEVGTSAIAVYVTLRHQVEDEDLAVIAQLAGECGLRAKHWTVYPDDQTAVTLRVVFEEAPA